MHEQDDVLKLLQEAGAFSVSLLPTECAIRAYRQDAADVHRSTALPLRQPRGRMHGRSARIAV